MRIPGWARKIWLPGPPIGVCAFLGKAPLVRPPPQFGGRRAFLVEALDGPRVHELVDGLRPRGDLRVPFGDVDDLGAGRLAEPRERSFGLALRGGDQLLERHPVHASGRRQAAFEHLRADFEQRPLREMAHEAGVSAVVHDGGGGWLAARVEPISQEPDPHLPGIQAALVGRLVHDVAVRIPLLERRVDVVDAMLGAPRQHVERLDVPRQVDDGVARAHEAAEQRGEVVRRQALALERHARLQRILDPGAHILEVHHRDAIGRHVQVPAHEGQRALAHRSAAEHQDASAERSALREWRHVVCDLIAASSQRGVTSGGFRS